MLYAQNMTSLIKYKMQMNVANNVPTIVYYKQHLDLWSGQCYNTIMYTVMTLYIINKYV